MTERGASANLLDAVAAHVEHPRTYSIPRRAVRESLKPGDLVKLLFNVDPPAGWVEVERMWVEVAEVNQGTYRGRLVNQPAYLPGLTPGAWIDFEPKHVAARNAEPEDPLYTDPNAFAVVSKRVWEADEWPGRLERHPIPDPKFSGWFVLAGDETAEFKADWNNFLPVPQGTLFDKFRVLDSGLEGPTGTIMIWSDAAAEYEIAGI